MQSAATTVAQYLAELPADRRAAIETVRQIILQNIDPVIEEGMQYGMIGYYIPHAIYPAGYHCDPKQPLPFACLASQKNYMSLYCMSLYAVGDEEQRFRDDWAKAGKKLDMGKSCIRFKRVEDLALDVIAKAIQRVTAQQHIAFYEKAIKTNATAKGERSATKKKAAPKKATLKKTATKKRAATPTAAKKPTAKKKA